jgi:multidrug efflux pump subunit AcrB
MLYFSVNVEKDFDLNISDEIVRIEGEIFESSSKIDTLNQVQKLYDQLIALDTNDDFETIDLSIGSVWRDREVIVSDKVFRIIARVKEGNPQPEAVKDKFLKEAKQIVKAEKKKFKLLSASKTWSNEETDKNKYLVFNFYTKNTKTNVNLKETLEALPEKIKGIGPLDLGFDNAVNRWVFTPNFAKMAQFGVNKNTIQTAILGKVDENWVREVRIEGKSYPVNMTINGSEILRNGFDPSKVMVLSQNQRLLPVDKIGTWRLEQSPKSIRHLNGYKVQGARFKINDERNRAEIVKQAESFVDSIESKFPEYIITTSGETVEEAENKAWVLKALVACILGIFFVLAITLNSITQPLIVSLPIPFAAAGVMWMHQLHDMPLGVFSMIGLIGAIGVSVNGTLIMSDQINMRLAEAKYSLFECVQIGSASRLRALFLTTVTTLGGLFPMAYALGGDSGFTRPLAFAMAWGILFSSLMTLVFYPSIYLSLATIVSVVKSKFEDLIPGHETETIEVHPSTLKAKPLSTEKPALQQELTD